MTTTTMYTITEIDPCAIVEPHEIRDEEKAETITESMREGGWQGRPILVFETKNTYQAITGSHRIPSACSAGLETIPCVVISRESILNAGCKIVRRNDFNRYFIRDEQGCDITSYDEYEGFIKEIGNAEGLELLREEIEHENA